MSVRAIRGATTADENAAEEIVRRTKELLGTIVERNALQLEEIVSVFFSVTRELDAERPSQAAHLIGWSEVPLLNVLEVSIAGDLPNCIRVLIHINTTKAQRDIVHVYLRGARDLRPDWASGLQGDSSQPRPCTRR